MPRNDVCRERTGETILFQKQEKRCNRTLLVRRVYRHLLGKHIKAREILLKGANRAKTAHPGEFNPDAWIGGAELDYRFNNAKTIIRDIFESEGKVDAQSK